MPVFKFDIDQDDYSEILTDKTKFRCFLEHVLCNKESDNAGLYNDMKVALLAYQKADGGSPVLNDYQIADYWFDDNTLTGKLKFKYKVSFTYGCADIHRTDEFTETCKFEITPDEKLLLFITDYIERDMVDEF